ncbi:chromosome segregation protein SMC [Bacteriovorax sp. BSW11_IV]|uniref:chromosome segregation protein SMC n=1 Tax=Bacteriovorax sp. BSW11_IV TaxID=1353529 RepID=UPI00038A3C79|nr:chromosome segregation protein SMC [Bacteriovorax sp. BSW11_IV]EQC46294.1 chromosome segregation protein SMC [Bacteriovorax sp. BSW11_IV]
MKLKRLIIQGFKSFKDRTVINFDDGITGIVGPNGCGKSNIVDALFWVMGEQSAKHLRGKSMKDLIFAGSSKYKPGAFAEASLVLENDDGKHIHIGNKVSSPSEIMLTRKLYRNGETEYRINNIPARLKDIQEVFMDTGAGAKSYSIIAQGEINRLVQAKPEERRTMIEEVAGITKFKIRKRESVKKIEQTEQNLARLSDLQQEIEKNLKALEKQAEKAEKARTLRDKIKRNEVVVNAHRVFDLLKDLRDGKVALNEKTIEVETWGTRKDSLEISLEEERYNKEEQTDKIETLSKERNEISNQLAKSEERLNSLCNSLTDKEKQIELREKELEELKEELAERLAKQETLKVQIKEIEDRNNEDYDYSHVEELVESLKEQLEFKTASASELKEELDEKKEKMQNLSQTVFQNTSKLEEYSANLEDITTEIEALEKQYSGVSKEIQDERDAVHAAEKLLSELTSSENVLRAELEALQTEVKTLERDLREKSKDVITTESRLNSLKEINASLEGAKEGAQAFLLNADETKYSLLGSLIKCDDQYTKAVQLLLADYLDTLVSNSDDTEDFNAWCAANTDKAVDFLVGNKSADLASPESLERLKIAFGEELKTLGDIVEIAPEYKSRLMPFFDGFFLVPELESSKFKSLSFDLKYKAVASYDGSKAFKNVGNGKLVTIKNASDEGQGVIARNNLIQELETKLVIMNEELTALEETVAAKTSDFDSKQDAFDVHRNKLSDGKADFAAKKSALDSKLAGMASGNTRLDILKNRKQEISRARLDLLENEESLANNLKSLKEDIEDLAMQVEELQSEIEDQKASYDENKQELLQRQLEAKSFADRISGLTSQIEDIDAQKVRMNARIESNVALIEKLNEEINHVNDEIETLEASNHKTAEVLSDKDEVLSMLKDQFSELLLAMQEREDEVKDLSKKINKNEKEVAELEIKMAQMLNEEEEITRNIFEKYRIDLRYTIGHFLEFSEDDFHDLKDVSGMYFIETENGTQEIDREDYEFVRRYGQDLKDCSAKLKNYKMEYSRLGEINWQAIEDYDRQKLRFEFLKVQETELRGSLQDLQTAIGHIDEKSKERFAIAYEEVNTRFQKVFPIIFGGGSATLRVTGNLDDAECGVDIIAQPPGKKMQNINLMSGGEKAMTAVSLIFSIFLVKPSPFCLLDEVDAPLDDANVGRFNELLREMSSDSQFILITHNKKTMELNDTLYGVTMQEPGVSKAVSVQLH